MAEPFLGELRLFPIGYAPYGWLPCNGQTLSIHTNQALYAILGPTYGGNGTTTFSLPDLRGRVPLHRSSTYAFGTSGGEEKHVLSLSELPAHTHTVNASADPPAQIEPTGHVWAALHNQSYSSEQDGIVNMHGESITHTGGNEAHNNMQPYIGLQFCIAIQGIFPSRN